MGGRRGVVRALPLCTVEELKDFLITDSAGGHWITRANTAEQAKDNIAEELRRRAPKPVRAKLLERDPQE